MVGKKIIRCVPTLLVIVAGIVLIGFLLSGLPDIRPTVKRSECGKHLHTLYDALSAYIAANGDVPHDDNGRTSVQPLIGPDALDSHRLSPSVLKCPAVDNSDGFDYIVNPALSASDFGGGSRTIVVCDRPKNHAECMLILLGDGSVRTCTAPPDQREKLAKAVQSGDKDARTYDDPYDTR